MLTSFQMKSDDRMCEVLYEVSVWRKLDGQERQTTAKLPEVFDLKWKTQGNAAPGVLLKHVKWKYAG